MIPTIDSKQLKETKMTEEKKEIIVELLKELKAEDITLMKMSELTSITDYFILCSTDNTMLGNAIVQSVIEKMKEHRWKPLFYPWNTEATWIVLDFGDVVLHIFHPDERKRYDLETLWDMAPKTYISS
ncbi:MAG TPA: ribosome silencing factor [Caldisericia bacterium]|nr:ribosome silencing factor [Caldisericia bacterium]